MRRCPICQTLPTLVRFPAALLVSLFFLTCPSALRLSAPPAAPGTWCADLPQVRGAAELSLPCTRIGWRWLLALLSMESCRLRSTAVSWLAACMGANLHHTARLVLASCVFSPWLPSGVHPTPPRRPSSSAPPDSSPLCCGELELASASWLLANLALAYWAWVHALYTTTASR